MTVRNRLTTKQREELTESYTMRLADDPIWEVGDIRLLSISRKGLLTSPPLRKYRVIGRTRKDDSVRYELRPL